MCSTVLVLHDVYIFLVAFGKSVYCLAKIGEELFIEALEDGVSIDSISWIISYHSSCCVL